MRFYIKTTVLSCIFLCISTISNSQTTTVDFTKAPWSIPEKPINFYDPGGCGSYRRFGPNPLPLEGINIRTVGATWLSRVWPMDALNLYAWGAIDAHYDNSNVSIEYPFKANKTYEIEIHGGLDHQVWLEGTTRPSSYTNAVFWLKLDNNPEIVSNATNKCEASYTPVEKIVNRYSKLIADGNREINSRIYKVKFSPLESRKALKLTYDPSPMDPALRFDEIFRLWYINITEMPYEEEPIRENRVYTNVPSATRDKNRGNPLYYIPGNPRGQLPTNDPVGYLDFTINPQQWNLSSDGSSYETLLSNITSNIYVSSVTYLQIYGDMKIGARDGKEYQEMLRLPTTFQNVNFSFELVGDDILIKVINKPISPIKFNLKYMIN